MPPEPKDLVKTSNVVREVRDELKEGWDSLLKLGSSDVPTKTTPLEVQVHPGWNKGTDVSKAWAQLEKEAPAEGKLLRQFYDSYKQMAETCTKEGNALMAGKYSKMIESMEDLLKEGAPAVIKLLGKAGGAIGLIGTLATMASAAEHGYKASSESSLPDKIEHFAESVLALGSLAAPTRPAAMLTSLLAYSMKGGIPYLAGQSGADLKLAEEDAKRASRSAEALSDVMSKTPEQVAREGKNYEQECKEAMVGLKGSMAAEKDPTVRQAYEIMYKEVETRKNSRVQH
jgi:hypothetical protein